MTDDGARQPVSGATRLAAVIGDPVRHSLSPTLHNAGFAALGLDWIYVALPVSVDDGPEAVHAARLLGIDGLSVTMPHKQAVAETVDELTPLAEALGAVNCVQRVGDRMIGHNTDGTGFVRSVQAQMGFEAAGSAVAVVGAGGAAAAVATALCAAGADVTVINRTRDRAAALADVAGPRCSTGDHSDIATADLVVQSTPLGMAEEDPLPFDPNLLRPGQMYADLIYHPARTPMVDLATERGVRAVNGVGMLLYQAAEQFELWTGQSAPVDTMAAAVGLSLDTET